MATPESARRSSSRTLVDAPELEIRSLRVLVLNRFAGEMQELERCRTVARRDTEIVFENIADVYQRFDSELR